MPKNDNIKKKPKKKPAKKQTKAIPKNVKRPERMVKVTLPAVIPGRGVYDPEPPPSIYEIEYEDAMLAVRMEKLAAKGLSNNEIINNLDISRDTFYKRLKNEPYFSYCLNKHRNKAVIDVENSLFKAANGFEYTEQSATPSGKVVTLNKQKTPDTAAIKFFLTNRDPANWKNKVEQTHEVGAGMQAMAFVIKRREE